MYERMTLTKWDDDRDGEIQITGTYIYHASESRGVGSCEVRTQESNDFDIEKIEFEGRDVTADYNDSMPELSTWCLENLPE